MVHTFSKQELEEASKNWGCNCGPSALAFALQMSLVSVRGVMSQVGFDAKRYTSPSMMKHALCIMGARWAAMPTSPHAYMFDQRPALVRIQWTGPWTDPHVVSKKWAYCYTHWITTWAGDGNMAFDCNGGVMSFAAWENDIPPMVTSTHPRADGGWFPTDVWRIER